MSPSKLVIRRLAPELQDDFLQFFEGIAFADNPKWRSCYCQFPYVDHSAVVWSERTGAQNRASACERMANGRMQGLLAYQDGQVVGWCNAAPRALMGAYNDEPLPDGHRVGQIGCFVVAQAYRRSGVARTLLEAACGMLCEQGLDSVLANPSAKATTDAQHHYGPLALYLAAGFAVVQERDDGLVVVRRSLRPATA